MILKLLIFPLSFIINIADLYLHHTVFYKQPNIANKNLIDETTRESPSSRRNIIQTKERREADSRTLPPI